MVDNFETKYYSYKNRDSIQAYTNPVEFVKRGILSIFDKDNSLSTGAGSISENEFKAVTKKQYDEYVTQMKAYYIKIHRKDLEYHIPTYYELSNMINNTDNNVFKHRGITPEDIEEPIVPNSRIGQSNQASSGNCYQIASDLALDTNLAGKLSLQFSIRKNYNVMHPGYYVTLFGAKDKNGNVKPRTYEISQKELKEAQEKYVNMRIEKDGQVTVRKDAKKYTTGDADVVLLDIATERYRKETGHELLTRNKKEVKGYDDYLSTGYGDEQLSLISGKKSHYKAYTRSKDVAVSDQDKNNQNKATKTKRIEYSDKSAIEKDLKFLEAHKDSTNATAMFKLYSDGNRKEFEKYGLIELHLYAIDDINTKNNTVTITNPHNGKYKKIVFPMSIFKKYCQSISYIDQNEPMAKPKPKKNDSDAKKYAKEIYNQICGPSNNSITKEKLKRIDSNNAAQIITEYKKFWGHEPLAIAIDKEWGLDIETVRQYVCTPLIKQAKDLGCNVNMATYNNTKDIKSLNKFIDQLVSAIYKKLD